MTRSDPMADASLPDTQADLVWFWIGSHAEYDKLLGQKPAIKLSPSRKVRRQKSKRAKLVRG
jgi:hypothetical protein